MTYALGILRSLLPDPRPALRRAACRWLWDGCDPCWQTWPIECWRCDRNLETSGGKR